MVMHEEVEAPEVEKGVLILVPICKLLSETVH